jgi:uncharacterized protein YdeI (YjbR/CyaY-like superfamily)
MYFGGTAKIWYKTLPVEDRKEYKLKEKLVKSFQRIEVSVRKLQELDRNQQKKELVTMHTYKKLKLCNQMIEIYQKKLR